MRAAFRRALSSMLVMIAFAGAPLPALATNYGDLWWNPAESGWGMQASQQGNAMFITLYVFRQDRSATWLNGLAFATSAAATTFSGELYRASGPYYGGAFAPPAVNQAVGTMTFQANSPTTATLTYTVEGVTVTKAIQRLPLRLHNLSGTYIGSFLSVQTGCTTPPPNPLFNGSGQFTIVHNPPAEAVTITAVLSDNLVNFTCNYQGTYSQLGNIGSIAGTYTCTSGQAGTWNATEIELSTLGGILGRYGGTNAPRGCQLTGGFGGLKPPG